MPFEELSQLNSQSLIGTPQELQDATFSLSADGAIKAVDGLSELSGVPESCYYSEHHPEHQDRELPRPINTSNLSPKEEVAIIERTQPPVIPLRPRHLYTPTDTSFLDARLGITEPLTFHVSPMPHPLPNPHTNNP